jgi:uncharacterized protein (DUF169 family)
MGLKDIHKKAEDIWEKLRLRTHILAIKLLRDVNDIPKGAIRPIKDLGYHLDLCQSFAMSRWAGETIAMLKEDMWCFEPVVGFGLAEAPEIFLQGNNRFPASAMNQKAGKKWAQSFPYIKLAKYIGIVSAPLSQCSFEPDMFIIYCDPSQLTQLLIAKECIDGISVNCTLSGHAACVYAVVPVIQNKQCIVSSPCLGDRRTAMTQDNEIMFSGLIELLEDLSKAFEYLDEQNMWRFPWVPTLYPEHKLSEIYTKIGKIMGMNY